MNENIDDHIDSEETNNEISWACKICIDLPRYAEMYLRQRESKKNELKGEAEQCADLILMKYYYALLCLLDEIHKHPKCSNPKNMVSDSANQKCLTRRNFDYYRYIYNTYETILRLEKKINQINLKCDICAVLPYTIFDDLEVVAKNMQIDEIKKSKKLELEAVITNHYLKLFGFCERWSECKTGTDSLELIRSFQLLMKYLNNKKGNELQNDLSDWNRARAIDNILNIGIQSTYRDFQTKDIILQKKLVYMDFGVYQLYEDNEIFRSKIDCYCRMDEIQFVYSPTHMEEVCRMGDSIFENKR